MARRARRGPPRIDGAEPVTVDLDPVLDRLLDGLDPLEPLEIPLLEAAGCATSFAVHAPADVPHLSTAIHDGYCVRMEDVAGASALSPRTVPVVGDTRPGDPPLLSVQPGFCVRITAGAAVPTGTEAVVPTSDTDAGVARVVVERAPHPGEGILPQGARVQAGAELVPAGTLLKAQHLGMLAAAGLDRVTVSPRPRVVAVPIGDELVDPGQPLAPGRWSDATGTMLTAAMRDAGALAFRVPPLRTDARTLIDTIEDQLVRADLVVLVAPSGAAEQAVVREVLDGLGAIEAVDSGPAPLGDLGWGRVGPDATPLLVLPHDPLAAWVAAELVVRPVVRRLLGLMPERPATVRAVLRGTATARPDRAQALPADLGVQDGVYAVEVVKAPGHALQAAVAASAVVLVPAGSGPLAEGATVDVVVLERRHA
jgi:molybdopterin molybdotransferase